MLIVLIAVGFEPRTFKQLLVALGMSVAVVYFGWLAYWGSQYERAQWRSRRGIRGYPGDRLLTIGKMRYAPSFMVFLGLRKPRDQSEIW